MTEHGSRMLKDMQLAGLSEGPQREYQRAGYHLASYSMVSPDLLS